MTLEKIKGVFHSVQAKMILISLVTWICLVLAVGTLIFIHRFSASHPFQKNAVQYFTYVVEDLGLPPDIEKAKRLSEKTDLKIAYTGPGTPWSTIEGLPDTDLIWYHKFPKSDRVKYGKYKGRRFIRFTHDNGDYIFEFSEHTDDETRYLWLHIAAALILSLIIAGAYLAVKRTLRPIRWLRQGVEEVGKGNLTLQLPENRRDEFGKLARAFNTMTQRLSQMLSLKQRLLRDVSHELRSPLTRVKVALEFPQDEQTKESIRADIREMESMITNILESARIHHDHSVLEKLNLDLAAFARDISEDFKDRLPNIRVGKMPRLSCSFDPERMKIVLGNVIDNALKYSEDDDLPVEISCDIQDRWAVIRIQDRGQGIDPSKLNLVTEPFYRLDNSRSKQTGGYGLGLSLCKTIMDAHGGKIELASEVGRGTCVSLWLPLD